MALARLVERGIDQSNRARACQANISHAWMDGSILAVGISESSLARGGITARGVRRRTTVMSFMLYCAYTCALASFDIRGCLEVSGARRRKYLKYRALTKPGTDFRIGPNKAHMKYWSLPTLRDIQATRPHIGCSPLGAV